MTDLPNAPVGANLTLGVEPLPANRDTSLPDVSLVVATYNRGDVLLDTLRMALALEYLHLEIIVVDQTPDPEEAYLACIADLEADPRFRYVRLYAASLTYARNVGIGLAKGRVVLFVDDDVEFEPDFVAAHAQCYADPEVGAVAGRVYETRYVGMMPDTVREDPSAPIGVLRSDGSCVGNFHLGRRQDVDFGKGCNMSFRRDLVVRAGGCDERYRGGFYREDGDLFARVKRLGARVVFEPEAWLVHLESGGGSRTEGGHVAPRREQTVFHNETLFYLSCMDERRPLQFYYRMLRWGWAVKQTRGYSLSDLAVTLWGVWTGTLAYFARRPDRLSRRYGRTGPGLTGSRRPGVRAEGRE